MSRRDGEKLRCLVGGCERKAPEGFRHRQGTCRSSLSKRHDASCVSNRVRAVQLGVRDRNKFTTHLMSPAALVNPHSCFVVLADTGQAMQKVRRREREPLLEHVLRVKHMVDRALLQPMIEGARVVGFDSCLVCSREVVPKIRPLRCCSFCLVTHHDACVSILMHLDAVGAPRTTASLPDKLFQSTLCRVCDWRLSVSVF